jgi:hypothetical protein
MITIRPQPKILIPFAVLVFLVAAISFGTSEKPSEVPAVTWDLAVGMIRQGRVDFVAQSHGLNVWLRTDDGGEYQTRQPRIDVVWDLVREVDPDGEEIRFLTE